MNLRCQANQFPPGVPFNGKVKIGRELVTTLSLQVYQLASTLGTKDSGKPAGADEAMAKMVMNSLPLPLIVMDKNQAIIFANEGARKYLNLTDERLITKNMYKVLDLSFPSDDTYDKWLEKARGNTATASNNWEHVRLELPDKAGIKQFDMAAHYNKDNPTGVEAIIALFDHTDSYGQDDEAISFIALAVHELRNPLTMLRGYIDVFEEELEGKLSEELADFMKKMQVAAGQLSAFVNNILNVARVENDQLVLELGEEKWVDVVQGAINSLALRAQIHKKTIEFTHTQELPTVGVDNVSIYEVLTNILDNAIKYSGEEPKKIIVATKLTTDGLIETTIQDFGPGIPSVLLPNLFEKFYRNHRTQSQVGGTGLGLYLSKAIITAHGGQIWVKSKEREGTTFGFTLLPYTMMANKPKTGDNNGIVRGAHGWIKNHSLYRR